jgi:ATP-binding protein involved in chromosome partitioning
MTPMRTYREITGGDRSGLAAQVASQRARVAARLADVRHVVAIMSGKGGVGKSFVTAALATGSAKRLGGGIGVLDADLHGPTAAHLLGARGPVRVDAEGVEPAGGNGGIKVFSMELLLPDGAPLRWREPSGDGFVWRGALEAGALREFLADVAWGALDLLLVDLPPGTAPLRDLGELVPTLDGVVAVTIPSEESRRSVSRAIQVARGQAIKVLGLIENMSGYVCEGCGKPQTLFSGDAGTQLARQFRVPLLGRVPFAPEARPGVGDAILATDVIDRFREVLSG